jgi:hypothetical protein
MTKIILSCLALIAVGCAIHARAQRVLDQERFPFLPPGAERGVVTGRTISMTVQADGSVETVIATAGSAYVVRVVALTRAGMIWTQGDSVTAWVRRVAGALVADSLRVEPAPVPGPQ